MNATTNQIIAMCFPLLTVVVVWLVALFVRRRLNNQRVAETAGYGSVSGEGATANGEEIRRRLDRVRTLIRQADRELHHLP